MVVKMRKQPFDKSLYQLGNENFDTRFDMDMLNIEAFEENLEKEKLKAEVYSERETINRINHVSPEVVRLLRKTLQTRDMRHLLPPFKIREIERLLRRLNN